MNFFEKILHSLSGEMTEPTNYGWFHIMFCVIIIGFTVFLCTKFSNSDDKTFRRIMLISWIVMVALEIYKQLIFSFEYENGVSVWDYQWYAFPYQLCSTPLYVLPFIAFFKDSKFRDAMISYMSTFSFFGGLAVFFYPNDVFIETTGINIQTMVHHGLQVALAIYCVAYNRKKLANDRYFLSGIPVFAVLVGAAIIMNIIGYHLIPDETFNMFYISPYFDCTLPLLNTLYPKVPFIAFILIYIIGFVVIAALLYHIEKLIVYLATKEKVGKSIKCES